MLCMAGRTEQTNSSEGRRLPAMEEVSEWTPSPHRAMIRPEFSKQPFPVSGNQPKTKKWEELSFSKLLNLTWVFRPSLAFFAEPPQFPTPLDLAQYLYWTGLSMEASIFVWQRGLTCLGVKGGKPTLKQWQTGKACVSPELNFQSWWGQQQTRELARNLIGIFQGNPGNESHRGAW